MSIQQVFFTNPSQITQIQNQIGNTPGQINTTNVNATGSISALGDITIGSTISVRNLQDQVYNLQAAVNPSVTIAGAMNTQSFFGTDTQPNQVVRSTVDNFASKHFYDQGGLSSENVQYLQLENNASIPTNFVNSVMPSLYKNATGTYIFGSSNGSLFFTGSSNSLNLNRYTRREQFNLLQDINLLTGAYSAGYTGFVSAWNSGLADPTRLWTQGAGAYTEATLNTASYDALHVWGTYGHLWRYDVNTKQVIARSVVSLTKQLWGDASDNWKYATVVEGFVTSFNNDWFSVPIVNTNTYGLLVFDVNLNPITIMQANAYAGPTSGIAGVAPLPFNIQGTSFASFNLQTDQIRSAVNKQWSFAELGTGTFTSLIDGSRVDIFSGNTGSLVNILYVSSSSQGSYNANERTSNMMKYGTISPLSISRWEDSVGKLIAWALCTGAAAGVTGATGSYASANGWRLVPIAIHTAAPDNYQAGNLLQLDSFTLNPLTQTYDDLSILYPLADVRPSQVYLNTGSFRLYTGSYRSEGFEQFTFYTGSSTGARSAGIQPLCISIQCMTGFNTATAFRPYNLGTGTLSFPRNKRHFQDLFGQYYYQYTDATGTYFQQNYLEDGTIILTDPLVKFYIVGGSLTTPQYIDTTTGLVYVQQTDGTYLSSPGGLVDPSPNASIRQQIMNNGWAVRHCFTPYNMRSVPASSGNINPFILPNFNNTSNNSPQALFADFFFPDGHQFSISSTYASEPFSLTYIDWNNFIGNYTLTNAAARYNTNYAQTGLYSATGIKDYFAFTQSGLSTSVINVRLPNESYTGVNGTGIVPVGSVVFEVKGEVFNGQPIKKKLTTSNVNNTVLTQLEAEQLGYNGGGLYGNTSLWQDPNGNNHIFVGHSNATYMPYSEITKSANYAAKQLISDIQTGKISSTISATTLRKIGLDNVQSVPGPDYRTPYTETNCGIYNANGKFVFDCSMIGIVYLQVAFSNIARGISSSGPQYSLINMVSGVRSNVQSDAVGMPYINTIWFQNAYGETVTFTGQECIEAYNLCQLLRHYHTRYMSNRRRLFICNNTVMLNAKTLQVEQIIRGYPSVQEIFAGPAIRDCLGLADNYQTDSPGSNADEVGNIVTCGTSFMSTRGKQTLKIWKVSDCTSSYATIKSFGSNTKFACTYDGSLGQQITYAQIPTIVYNTSTTTTTTTVTSMTGYTGAFLGILSNYTGSYTGSDGYYTGTYGPLSVEIFATGPLGPQVAISQSVSNSVSTTTSSIVYTTGPVYSYGNVTEILSNWSGVAVLNGSLMYLGKQSGKDIFAIGMDGGFISNAINAIQGTSWFELQPGMKLNLPNNIEGASPVFSADGKVVLFIPTKGPNLLASASNAQAPLCTKYLQAFTLSDDGTFIKKLWTTVTTFPTHPELFNCSGTGTNLGSTLTINRANESYARSNGGLTNSSAIAVNDVIINTMGATTYIIRADTGEILSQFLSDDLDWDQTYLQFNTNATTNVVSANGSAEHGLGACIYNDNSLYFIAGALGRSNGGGAGRYLHELKLKINTPGTVTLTSLQVATGSVGSSNSQTVVFSPQDAIAQNGNQFCLLTTFKTSNYFNIRKSEYIAIDNDYDALYLAGITAIAIYDPTNTFLAPYQTPSLDLSTKFINGGSWYQRTGISFKNLLASGVVKFLYAGQIPYKVRAQTPFTVSQDQIEESILTRRQKKLLQEYYRSKGQVTSYQGYQQVGPYPDNGYYVENNTNYIYTVKFKPFYYWSDPKDATRAVIYNQPLGYTDVGTRPLPTPL